MIKRSFLILGLLASLAGICNAQSVTNTLITNGLPGTILGTLESYLMDNPTNFNPWASNHIDIWEAAVFQQVNGVPGDSAVGNTLGLEVPVYRFASNQMGLHLESVTDFETVFGDVGWQAAGVGFDYNIHAVQLSAGLDANLALKGPLTVTAAPYIELKKASTSLNGLSPFIRWEWPIRGKAGPGILFLGLQVPL